MPCSRSQPPAATRPSLPTPGAASPSRPSTAARLTTGATTPTREAAVKDRTRKRQEIRSFLLRHDKIYPGKKAWGTKYFKWLHELSFGWPAQKVVLHEMIVAESQCRERVARLDAAIEDALPDWPLAPVMERLQALRGVGLIAAVTFMVEVGDVRRFEHSRQLMAYLGLVPSERSTGDSVRRGGITKTGNARGLGV